MPAVSRRGISGLGKPSVCGICASPPLPSAVSKACREVPVRADVPLPYHDVPGSRWEYLPFPCASGRYKTLGVIVANFNGGCGLNAPLPPGELSVPRDQVFLQPVSTEHFNRCRNRPPFSLVLGTSYVWRLLTLGAMILASGHR